MFDEIDYNHIYNSFDLSAQLCVVIETKISPKSNQNEWNSNEIQI